MRARYKGNESFFAISQEIGGRRRTQMIRCINENSYKANKLYGSQSI
ncbi:hypothetical protein KHA96_17330 [Bacillus sp. FJAT-49711]|nr:hypothetical protein [Bacillus sp. FJAT-49711]MBS4220077.1 hypothetical protein [Bacillus sp. FJAT-49711]